jgi:hypothetical protein
MLIATVVLLQVLIPLGLLSWLVFGRPPSRTEWILRIVIAASYLSAITLAGLWLILPWYTPLVYLAVLVVAIVLSGGRARSQDRLPSASRGKLRVGIQSALALLGVGLVAYAFSGRRPAGGTVVDLAFPLAGGGYLVAGGGSNALLNPHVQTLSAERFRPFRGQSYGVDLVQLNEWGFRATGFRPSDPAAYEIFGEPVYAPCAGRVVQAEDGLRDLHPPQKDSENLGGNYVILECGDVWVLLGHLQQGTVLVAEAEMVETGQEVGRVGNSGNTDEPHLHIHAQRPGTSAAPLGGDPLPFRLNGRHLARNDRMAAER